MDPAIVDVAEQARLNVAREAQVPWSRADRRTDNSR
jgi:hypothetical protein